MLAIVAKAVLTAAFIIAMAELAKRSTFLAALFISLPLATALTVFWLYVDTKDAARAGQLAWSTLLLVPPGLVFLIGLPLGIRLGLNFWASFALSAAATAAFYFLYATLLQRVFGITL